MSSLSSLPTPRKLTLGRCDTVNQLHRLEQPRRSLTTGGSKYGVLRALRLFFCAAYTPWLPPAYGYKILASRKRTLTVLNDGPFSMSLPDIV